MYLTSYPVGDDLSFCDKSFSGGENLGGTLNADPQKYVYIRM